MFCNQNVRCFFVKNEKSQRCHKSNAGPDFSTVLESKISCGARGRVDPPVTTDGYGCGPRPSIAASEENSREPSVVSGDENGFSSARRTRTDTFTSPPGNRTAHAYQDHDEQGANAGHTRQIHCGFHPRTFAVAVAIDALHDPFRELHADHLRADGN